LFVVKRCLLLVLYHLVLGALLGLVGLLLLLTGVTPPARWVPTLRSTDIERAVERPA
jgi:hypothetical protein